MGSGCTLDNLSMTAEILASLSEGDSRFLLPSRFRVCTRLRRDASEGFVSEVINAALLGEVIHYLLRCAATTNARLYL